MRQNKYGGLHLKSFSIWAGIHGMPTKPSQGFQPSLVADRLHEVRKSQDRWGSHGVGF